MRWGGLKEMEGRRGRVLAGLQGVAAGCGETRAPAIITLICKSPSEIKAQVNVC